MGEVQATKKYVVLLRGVMPTGKNKVSMAKLRDVLSEGGLRERPNLHRQRQRPGGDRSLRSKLSNNFLERKLGVSATTRNFNTMSRLVAMTTTAL